MFDDIAKASTNNNSSEDENALEDQLIGQDGSKIVNITCRVSSAFSNGGAVPTEYAVGTVTGDDSLLAVAAGLAEGADNRSAMPSAPVAATFFNSYYY